MNEPVRINEFALHLAEVGATTADACGRRETSMEPKLLLNLVQNIKALRRENEELRRQLEEIRNAKTKRRRA